MRWTYACPHCEAMLNPDETVVLIGECGPHRILIGFHPEPGNYRAFFPPEFELQEGSMWDFSCPVCDRSLVAGLCARPVCSRPGDPGRSPPPLFFPHRGRAGHLPDHRRGALKPREGRRAALTGDAGADLTARRYSILDSRWRVTSQLVRGWNHLNSTRSIPDRRSRRCTQIPCRFLFTDWLIPDGCWIQQPASSISVDIEVCPAARRNVR